MCKVSKPFPFFLSKELQKEPKTAFGKFRACGRDEGSALDLRAFEKARPKLSSCGGGPFG